MEGSQIRQKQKKSAMAHLVTWTAGLGVAILMTMGATRVHAQDFSDLKTALVDYSKADMEARKACEELGKFKSKDIVQITAAAMPATDASPAYCRVTGLLAPEIAFEVSLPAKWNGRFYMIGNGGFAGEALDDPGRVAQRNAALQLGFAFAQTNTGHDARKEPGATFVLSNPQKAIDYAYRAVHLTADHARTSRRIITANRIPRLLELLLQRRTPGTDRGAALPRRFRRHRRELAVGGSDRLHHRRDVESEGAERGAAHARQAGAGGRQGHGEVRCDRRAQGRPDRRSAQMQLRSGARRPGMQRGHGRRGLPDGRTSSGDRQSLQRAGQQRQAFFPGYMPGSEAVVPGLFGGGTGSGWMNVIVATQPDRKPADFNLAEGIMRYLVPKPPKPDYDYQTFDFDRDIHLLDDWSKLADAKNPDLSKFKKRGGKLIMTYGWADPILQPMMGVNYYEQAVAKNGPDTPDFFRLFMVPGMGHCGGGIGPDRHDSMTAMIDWVEKSKAPDSMLASRVVDNRVVRTRPLCPYPQVARYSGQGSIDDAANFRCVAP